MGLLTWGKSVVYLAWLEAFERTLRYRSVYKSQSGISAYPRRKRGRIDREGMVIDCHFRKIENDEYRDIALGEVKPLVELSKPKGEK